MVNAMLVASAKKAMPNPDAIIDVYDLTFVWVNTKAAKRYNASEMINKQIFGFTFMGKMGVRETLSTLFAKGGLIKIPIKSKDGRKILKSMRHKIFLFENNPYLATKFK